MEASALDSTQVGTNLRSLLGMHCMTQRELADHLGLSPQGIWNIVHGRSEPRFGTAVRAARAFGIDVDSLFDTTGSCLRAAAATYEGAPVRAGRSNPPSPLTAGSDEGRESEPELVVS